METEAETEELPDLVDVEGATIWDILRVETPDLTNTSLSLIHILMALILLGQTLFVVTAGRQWLIYCYRCV